MGWLADETGLDKCTANHVPLTPLSHLNRAADIWPDHPALVYGTQRWTYRDYHARVSRLASGLAGLGVRPGDVVVSSPASTLVPPNLTVGVIQSVDDKAVPAPEAVVQLSAPVDAVDWVQVLTRSP